MLIIGTKVGAREYWLAMLPGAEGNYEWITLLVNDNGNFKTEVMALNKYPERKLLKKLCPGLKVEERIVRAIIGERFSFIYEHRMLNNFSPCNHYKESFGFFERNKWLIVILDGIASLLFQEQLRV